jgi:hypothetical protein
MSLLADMGAVRRVVLQQLMQRPHQQHRPLSVSFAVRFAGLCCSLAVEH